MISADRKETENEVDSEGSEEDLNEYFDSEKDLNEHFDSEEDIDFWYNVDMLK